MSDVSSVSDRVVSVRINLQRRALIVIQVYTPTVEAFKDEEMKNFTELCQKLCRELEEQTAKMFEKGGVFIVLEKEMKESRSDTVC